MSEPYEIIVSPYQIYLAPVSETVPELDDVPAGNWILLGTNGKDNYAEDGVTVAHEQSLSVIRTLGTTGGIKVVRTEEELTISLILFDMSIEHYAKILNGVTLVDVAAAALTPGHRDLTLRQGPDVTTFALLCRGKSPYGDAFNAQYAVPIVYQSGNPSPVYNKGDAAGLALTFSALEDPNAATRALRFGELQSQDAVATG